MNVDFNIEFIIILLGLFIGLYGLRIILSKKIGDPGDKKYYSAKGGDAAGIGYFYLIMPILFFAYYYNIIEEKIFGPLLLSCISLFSFWLGYRSIKTKKSAYGLHPYLLLTGKDAEIMGYILIGASLLFLVFLGLILLGIVVVPA